MITVSGLTKQYGGRTVVDDVSFTLEPGTVTGFLGPNGAGKTTTMRMVAGLVPATSGSALVDGQPYAALPNPGAVMGTLLDAAAVHPGRTGRTHLRLIADALGVPAARVDEVLELVDLTSAAHRRIKGYSLGMRQRLGIAAALLGDPQVLLFDEPVNGLDLDGVRWIRALLRGFADEGRTVLVSSHLMSEIQLIADRVVIIGRGRLIADADIDEVLRGLGGQRVRVRTPHADDLRQALGDRAAVEHTAPGELEIVGLPATEIGDLAHALGLPVHHLAEVEQSLEHAYLSLTEDSVDYHGHTTEPVANGATR